MKKILIIAGARPNFMKIAPIIRALGNVTDIQYKIVHTGQHYDTAMSQSFFDELGIPAPHYNLEVGSGSHAVQTANIMIRFEEVCIAEKPDIVMVVGDVNSTVACGLVAKKLQIELAHVEAGLRSNDRSMPEEINRMVTDSISDYLFVTEKNGIENLKKEGHAAETIHFVGHVMIDNLFYQLKQLAIAPPAIGKELKSKLKTRCAACTLHRPSNVDNRENLALLLETLAHLSKTMPIVFPCHPRTLARIREFGLMNLCAQWKPGENVTGPLLLTAPLGYMDFLYLWKDAACVITDSGGLQEETTALKVPCITMRTSTERPITAEIGSNEVIGLDCEKLKMLFARAAEGSWKKSSIPELWDGKASERIVAILKGRAG
jgi:UDP-N-acetylglucosamine 2-epimerase (non-hydrolysing)